MSTHDQMSLFGRTSIEFRDLLRDFEGTKCAACGRRKCPHNSFCARCYTSLPHGLQRALYRHFGDGYEAAFERALKYLRGGPNAVE